MSDIQNFVTGFSNAVSGYMGENYKSSLDTQKSSLLANQKSDLNMKEDAYKQSLEGTVNPDMAEKLAPGMGLGDVINGFQGTNKRLPTTKEFGDLIKAHPKASAMASGHTLSTSSFLTILKNTPGIDQNTVANLAQDFQKQGTKDIPIGIGEAYISGLTKDSAGVSDSVLNTILTGDEAFNNLATVQEKAQYIQDVKASMKEPGKAGIKSDEDLDKVTNGVAQTYAAALKDPKKYPNPIAAVAKIVSAKYNKAATNRVLLRLASMEVDAQGNVKPAAPEQPKQNTGLFGGMFNGNGNQ